MASEPLNSQPESSPASGSSTDQLTVNLQVLSPSVGVNRPLLFPGIAASTTVKQLKEKIRQTLPLRPADENQRLIHRGRAIVKETDSLLDIFGAEALRTPDQQTIHLVVRDAHDSHTPTPPASARGPSPTAHGQPANAPRQTIHHAPYGPHPPAAFTRRNPMPPTSNPFPQPRMPSPSPIHTPEQAAAFQHHHQNMTQWLSHIQREAMARALVNQNQRNRAQMGMRGIGDTAGAPHNTAGDNGGSGRGSPAPGHTIYREHIGPNGHTYQVETVIRTSAPPTPNGGMTPVDVHNIIRGADATQATHAMTSAMQRSGSGTSIHNRPLTQPGVTSAAFPNIGFMPGNDRATPDPATVRPASMFNLATTAPGSSPPAGQGMDVYILSSPEGPRALLVNHSNMQTYYTPRLRNQASYPQLRYSAPNLGSDLQNQARLHHHHHHHHHHPRQVQQPQSQQQQQQQQPPPQAQHQQVHPQHAQYQQLNQHLPQQDQQVQAQGQNQVQVHQDVPPGVGIMHPGNPPVAAAVPALLLQLWPQIWLLFRLALFVWFFTSPDASWSRWFTIITVAVVIFIMSTGQLNALGDLARRVLGRHLENLIPPLEQPGGPRNAAQDQQNAPAGQNRDPNPADLAARLVAQHRGQESWVMEQIRRVERASLLFLASIAPGVAERHIANLEALERAVRLRREAEAAEAARLAEVAAAENNENVDDSNGNNENSGGDTQDGGNGGNQSNENDGRDLQNRSQTEGNRQIPETGDGQVNNRNDERPREQLIEI